MFPLVSGIATHLYWNNWLYTIGVATAFFIYMARAHGRELQQAQKDLDDHEAWLSEHFE